MFKSLNLKGMVIMIMILAKWLYGSSFETEISLDYMMRFIGTPYIYGGKPPVSFDCSELACEYLKSRGIITRYEDYTALNLFHKFKQNKVEKPRRGDLVFYQNGSGQIYHVEIMLGAGLALSASGGDSSIKTIPDAYAKGAFVRVEPIQGGLKHYVRVR